MVSRASSPGACLPARFVVENKPDSHGHCGTALSKTKKVRLGLCDMDGQSTVRHSRKTEYCSNHVP